MSQSRNWASAFSRRWKERQYYGTTYGWLAAMYDRTLSRLRRWPLPARKAICPVRLRGLSDPLYARLGSSDFLVIDELFFRREYDFLFAGNREQVKLVVDLGANCGYSTVLWLIHFPQARVIAVEPDASNLAVLRRNVASFGGDDRVSVIEACAAGHSRMVHLNRSGQEWEYSMTDGVEGASQAVPALTVPEILARCGVEGPIDLLKCDIEGAERELFETAGSWLHRVQAMLVEVHAPFRGQDLDKIVRRHGCEFQMTPASAPAPNQLFYFRRG
jgi:FkbM family methyltransferase